MRGLWLLARAHGLALVATVLVLVGLLLHLMRGQVLQSPGTPEGALVQVWLPTVLSVVAARACYDVGAPVRGTPRTRVVAARWGWLLFVAAAALALARPGTPPPGAWLHQVDPTLPVALVLATTYLLSTRFTFTVVASTGLVEALVLYFAARPALTGSDERLALLWNGAGGWDLAIAAPLLIVCSVVAATAQHAPATMRVE